MLQWFKENSGMLQEAERAAEKDLEGKIVVGEFVHKEFSTVPETLRNNEGGKEGCLKELR